FNLAVLVGRAALRAGLPPYYEHLPAGFAGTDLAIGRQFVDEALTPGLYLPRVRVAAVVEVHARKRRCKFKADAVDFIPVGLVMGKSDLEGCPRRWVVATGVAAGVGVNGNLGPTAVAPLLSPANPLRAFFQLGRNPVLPDGQRLWLLGD